LGLSGGITWDIDDESTTLSWEGQLDDTNDYAYLGHTCTLTLEGETTIESDDYGSSWTNFDVTATILDPVTLIINNGEDFAVDLVVISDHESEDTSSASEGNEKITVQAVMSMENEYPGAVCNLDATMEQSVIDIGAEWVNEDNQLNTQSSLIVMYGDAISSSDDEENLIMTIEGSGSTTDGNCHNTEWSLVDGKMHMDQVMDMSWLEGLFMEEDDIPEIDFPSIDMDACGNFQFPAILDFMAWDIPCEDAPVCTCSDEEPNCAVTASISVVGVTAATFAAIQDDFVAATEAALGLGPGSVIVVDYYAAKRSDDAGSLIVVLEFVPSHNGDNLVEVISDPAFIEGLDAALEVFGITAELGEVTAPASWPEECLVDDCVTCDLGSSACSSCSSGYELSAETCSVVEGTAATGSDTSRYLPLDPASITTPYLSLQLAFCALLALMW